MNSMRHVDAIMQHVAEDKVWPPLPLVILNTHPLIKKKRYMRDGEKPTLYFVG